MIDSLYEKFKIWSNGGSIYIISDTHFGDSDCKLMDPNWVTPNEQVQILRKYVHKNDTLIHLGDVGDATYLCVIPGYKVLIQGNHDVGASKYRLAFDEIYEGPLMIGEKILLSHEPILTCDWCLNIHGHDHSKYCFRDDFHLNVAANHINYTPINLNDVIREGRLSKITSLHRQTIDSARDRYK